MDTQILMIAALSLQSLAFVIMYAAVLRKIVQMKACDYERLHLLHQINEASQTLIQMRREEDRSK